MGTKDGTHSLDFGGGAKLWLDENSVVQSSDASGVINPLTDIRQKAFSTSLGGLIAENFSRLVLSSGVVTISGTVYAGGFYFFAGEVIPALTLGLLVTGSGVTLGRMGIYNSFLALVAQTAECSATFNASTGVPRIPLTAPYVVPVSGVYYLSYIAVGGIQPSPIGTAILGVAGVDVGWNSSAVKIFGHMDAQTDLPATLVFGAGLNKRALWFAAIK